MSEPPLNGSRNQPIPSCRLSLICGAYIHAACAPAPLARPRQELLLQCFHYVKDHFGRPPPASPPPGTYSIFYEGHAPGQTASDAGADSADGGNTTNSSHSSSTPTSGRYSRRLDGQDSTALPDTKSKTTDQEEERDLSMPLETDFVPISLPSHDGSLDAVALGLVSSKAEGGGLAERLASEADAIRSSEEEAQRLHTFEKERGRRGRKLQFTNAFTGYAWNEEQLDVLAIPRHERTEPQMVLLIPDWQRKLVLQTDLAREGAVARIQEQLVRKYGESNCNATMGCDLTYGQCLNISGLPVDMYDQNGTCVCHHWFTGKYVLNSLILPPRLPACPC